MIRNDKIDQLKDLVAKDLCNQKLIYSKAKDKVSEL